MFRLAARQNLIEELLLRLVLLIPVSTNEVTHQESLLRLEDWLQTNSDAAMTAYGAHFEEPAQTAFYGEIFREVVDAMKARARRIVSKEMKSQNYS